MELKTRETFKTEYFSWSLHDRDIRMEGKKEGRLEGMKEKAIETARTLLKMNLAFDQIATATGLSIQEVSSLSLD